jgi:hypothetical protein
VCHFTGDIDIRQRWTQKHVNDAAAATRIATRTRISRSHAARRAPRLTALSGRPPSCGIESPNRKLAPRQRPSFVTIHGQQPFSVFREDCCELLWSFQGRRQKLHHVQGIDPAGSSPAGGEAVSASPTHLLGYHSKDRPICGSGIGGGRNARGADQAALPRPGGRAPGFRHWHRSRPFRARALPPLRTTLDPTKAAGSNRGEERFGPHGRGPARSSARCWHVHSRG